MWQRGISVLKRLKVNHSLKVIPFLRFLRALVLSKKQIIVMHIIREPKKDNKKQIKFISKQYFIIICASRTLI